MRELSGVWLTAWAKKINPACLIPLRLALERLLAALQQGAVCVDLAYWADKSWAEGERFPPLSAWLEALQASGVVARAPAFMPLLLVDSRLYFARYWALEQQVADDLQQRAQWDCPVDVGRLQADLAQLFPAQPQVMLDGQKLAAATAVLRGLAVISGGPGTGKTTTVLRLLVALLRQSTNKIQIGLCAPTGKAAARLHAAMSQQANQLLAQGLMSVAEMAALPGQALTVHRLLGLGEKGLPRYHARSPLQLDVLVVDEASMLDLALCAKLCAALPREARLIFLGDHAQLAAVEVGAVFEALSQPMAVPEIWWKKLSQVTAIPREVLPSAARQAVSALAGCVVRLQHSYRFAAEAGIGALARAILAADGQQIDAVLQSPHFANQLFWYPVMDRRQLAAWVRAQYAAYFTTVAAFVANEVTLAAVFAAWEEFQLLCTQYEGIRGVEAMNALFDHGQDTWYTGRALIVTRNDYPLQVFNGDIGLVLPDSTVAGALRVFFPCDGGFRALHPARLPTHESAFALTVHKSQGSEFARVAVLLPEQAGSFADRRLLYTAVTRAKNHVTVLGSASVIHEIVAQQMPLSSGLAKRLHAPVAVKRVNSGGV